MIMPARGKTLFHKKQNASPRLFHQENLSMTAHGNGACFTAGPPLIKLPDSYGPEKVP
jgi:hypothetical protein